MAVSREDVRHIAELARLSVSADEADALMTQLNSILSHMEALAAVDTAGLAPVSGVGSGGTPLRKDSGNAIPLQYPISSFAPEMRDGFFLVPRLATHETVEEGG